MSRVCVIIASIGRPDQLVETVKHLARQTLPPTSIVVVSVTAADVEGLDAITGLPLEIVFGDKGLPKQRNVGLRHVAGKTDIIAFFDDDFVPADTYLENLDRLFTTRPEVVGMTGRVIADGIKTSGISFDAAKRLIDEDAPKVAFQDRIMPALYGCNLSVRASAIDGLWFDENLPLYGWQEDVDFSYQLGKRGTLLLTGQLAGVHMGIKSGRTSGRRLGYSQIANPVYLLRKQTIPPRLAWRLMLRNLAANAYKSFNPEPFVDRRGRLVGNVLALKDLMLGRLHPTHVWKL